MITSIKTHCFKAFINIDLGYLNNVLDSIKSTLYHIGYTENKRVKVRKANL